MKIHSDLLSGFYPGTKIRLIRGGISGGQSSSSQTSRTEWPRNFISGAQPSLGSPLSLDQVRSMMPQPRGLFSPSTGDTPAAPASTPAPKTTPPAGYYPSYPGIFPGLPSIPTAAAPSAPATPAETPATAPAAPAGSGPGTGLFSQQGTINTGIGAAPNTYAPPSDVNQGVNINAATATLAPQGYDQLRQSIFSQNYNPAAQEIERVGALQDRALQSQLAGAGLMSSGAGIGQVGRQQENRQQQLGNLATNAAATATGQVLTLQQQEAQANAERQQQANVQNAANVLQGNTANATNYLATMGLNEQTANQGRAAFLQYLGIQEADLARMDEAQRSNVATSLDAWLKQWATLAAAGRTGSGESSGWNMGILGGQAGGEVANSVLA